MPRHTGVAAAASAAAVPTSVPLAMCAARALVAIVLACLVLQQAGGRQVLAESVSAAQGVSSSPMLPPVPPPPPPPPLPWDPALIKVSSLFCCCTLHVAVFAG